MRIEPTPLIGAFVIDVEPQQDHRGAFARTFCQREFAEHGLVSDFVQCSMSTNASRGTLRGLHYQDISTGECKLVRCTRGEAHDVIVDLRPDSATFKKSCAFTLTAENMRAVYIPPGMAHGFQTLVDDTDIFYQMSAFHSPEFDRAVRWNDPAFGIHWPLEQPILSAGDSALADFQNGRH